MRGSTMVLKISKPQIRGHIWNNTDKKVPEIHLKVIGFYIQRSVRVVEPLVPAVLLPSSSNL